MPPHMHSLLYCQHPNQSSTVITMVEPAWTHHDYQKSIVDIIFHSIAEVDGFGHIMMTYIHQYGVIQNIFNILKICAAPSHPSLLPLLSLAATDFKKLSSNFMPFPNSDIVEIRQYVAFSDWLFLQTVIGI